MVESPSSLFIMTIVAVLLAATCCWQQWHQHQYELTEMEDLQEKYEELHAQMDLLLQQQQHTLNNHHQHHHQNEEEGGQEEPENEDPFSSLILEPAASGRRRKLQQASSSFTFASDFGVVGDSHADDTAALQAALNSAAAGDHDGNGTGGTVILPKGVFRTFAPLHIPAGVTLQGQGFGSSPLAISFDAGGSTIAYCGTSFAVNITGHAAAVKNLAVYDWPYSHGTVITDDGNGGTDAHCPDTQAAGGILLEGNGIGVESVTLENLLLYMFTNGTALALHAKNNGAVVFGHFDKLRIRHAKKGIHLMAEEGSVVNTNAFFDGVIWGGGAHAEIGLHAQGPGACNDNKFYAYAIEPSRTQISHVYVEGPKTNVKLLDARLEGVDMMALERPMIIIQPESYGNVMTGMLGHTGIQADMNRNPGIDFMSAKKVGQDPAPLNMFWNGAFHGLENQDRPNLMAGWTFTNNANCSYIDDDDSDEALFADHKVLMVDYKNFGGPFKLIPQNLPKSPGHSFATFGVYARSSAPNSISAAMRYESGSIISSDPHSGSGDWEFISMNALYDKSAPYFYFSITGDVELTAPTFVYGKTPATPGASLMSGSGAKMSGTLSFGVSTAVPPADGGDRWILPKNGGNVFEMDMQGNPGTTIRRLSYRTAERFPRGTIVHLLFSEAGTTVADQAYIKLSGGNFVSTQDSVLTLLSLGSSSWREISRSV